MKSPGFGSTVVLLFALAVSARYSAAQTMYAMAPITAPFDALFTVDLTTALGTRVNAGADFDVFHTGAAVSCNGTFYSFDRDTTTSGRLLSIDYVTGVATVEQTFTMAATSPAFGDGVGLAFAPDGTTLVANDANLYRLNTETSEIELVGAAGMTGLKSLVLGPDCELYAAGVVTGSWQFVRLDLGTGLGTALGPLAIGAGVISFEFTDSGRLYTHANAILSELDPTDGSVVATVGNSGQSFPGLGWDIPSACYTEPVANAVPPTPICDGLPIQLDGSPSTACGGSGLLYRWLDGASVVCPWFTSPTCTVVPPQTTTYTLEVQCRNAPGSCLSSVDVPVEVLFCPLAVRFDQFEAKVGSTGEAVITWTTSAEDGTLGFTVEAAPEANGVFEERGLYVDAHGSGKPYRLVDQPPFAPAWYRIVEFTSAGRGDVSAPFPARVMLGTSVGSRRRSSR